MYANFGFIMSDDMLNGRKIEDSRNLKPVTKEMVETFIRNIIRVSPKHNDTKPLDILFTFEAMMALIEINSAITVVNNIVENLKEEKEILEKIGGEVRPAVCERVDAVYDYEVDLKHLRCAKDILQFAKDEDKLY